jgi:hypothetical protein
MTHAKPDRQFVCSRCRDTYWVCEVHTHLPWGGDMACGCGGAGMPCPNCNASGPDERPRLPPDFVPDIDVEDDFPGLPKRSTDNE